jgi:hypothetical protein
MSGRNPLVDLLIIALAAVAGTLCAPFYILYDWITGHSDDNP